MNDELKKLSEILEEAMELRDLHAKELAELTDIPVYYVSALTSGDFQKLPAAPYVQGYLMRIAEVLKIDGNFLWQVYKNESSSSSLKISGPQDKLPTNRFALKTKNKKLFIIIGIILVLMVSYLIWRLDDLLGTPQIAIINPSIDNLIVNAPSIKLSGEINPRDKLIINNEEVMADKSGKFEKDLSLQPGLNTIEFKVDRFLGEETKVIRQVIYQP